MAEIIRFTPKSDHADQNLQDYIEAAKGLPFLKTYGIC